MNAIPGNVHKSAASVDYDPFAGAPLLRVVPTTEPQREVWLADQLGRDASLAFNESVSLRLRGALQVEALREALAALVARRDALRAAFGPDGETLCVLGNSAVALPVTDLSSNPNALWEHQRRAVENPFALTRGPLFRAELLRMGGEDHVLLLTAHHIVCDGWSWWLIVRELGALYEQQVSGNALALPPAAAFADYALAQAAGSRSNATVLADQAYWLSRFADGAPILDLPLDRPRPVQRSFASAREDYTLDAPLVNAIRRIGAHQGASLFATLLAGFATVLARLGGHDDVVIGIPAAGQSVDDHGDVVGHCVNLLPLRCQIEPTQSFGMLLGATQNTLLDALDHQRYTYGELLKKLRVSRDPSRLPLVSVMFNIDQALAQESTVFPALSLEFSSNPRSYENFELFINAVQVQGTLRLECQFNRDLFEAATVRRWLAAYEQLLRAACESPDAAVSSLTWMTASERIELQALQPKATAFDRQCGMHMHFERQCGNTPNRIALCTSDASITYAELDEYANRIANLLRAQGAHRGTLVGLALDRGIDMVAALLGILKSGAGYVPLDPSFPVERLAYMASDAGLAALITHSTHADKFDLRGRPVLALDQLTSELATASAEATIIDDDSALPESIAYVIYTSGSTGRPKGVSVPHRAVANFIHAMRMQPGMGADDRLVAVTTLSFDIAVLELMLPLSVGAQAIIADRETSTDGNALMRLLDSQQATMMQATPATWRLLLDAGWRGDPAFTVLCGGEPLPPDLAAQLLPRCGALWNLYGPTETTVWSTSTQVQHGSDDALPDIHIGRPIANTQVWVLDVHGNACPRGVPGEICIGGDGVTLGYLHRPELTAERFIADPFTPVATVSDGLPQPLLYRTGDRGRWRNDGNLEHLGRLDFQVKVRGYRIELGEIENALLTHPAVAEVLVMAREDRPGDVRLVAYAVVHAGLTFDELSMASHLRGTLPEYMIPQHIVMLATMPRLPNNKIDRKALPAPQANSRRADSVRVAPRDALETRIAAAMAQTLGMSEIGIHEDFFASGGHSLLAAQLTSRLNRELGISLSLRSLFDGPTVAKLTQAIRNIQGSSTVSPPPISHRPDQHRAPLTLQQEALWMQDQFDNEHVALNLPAGHRLLGPIDLAALDRAVCEIIKRQPSLRTCIKVEDDTPIQVITDHSEFSLLPVIDLGVLPVQERESALLSRINDWTKTPFDLSQAPLFRIALFRLSDEEHVLMFIAHHIIWDGWSFDIFYNEIAELYSAFSNERAYQLRPLDVTYADYATWQADWANAKFAKLEVSRWVNLLSPLPELIEIPSDNPRPAIMSNKGGHISFVIPAHSTKLLYALGERHSSSLFMTLFAAYVALLYRMTEQDDIIIGTPVRGRNNADLEPIMGLFRNTLPLRVRVTPGQSFNQLVADMRSCILDAFSRPEVSFKELIRQLRVPRDFSRHPIYQVFFSFQDVRARATQWGSLKHSRVELEPQGVTEDLGLWFVETATGLGGGLSYNADILRDDSARRIVDQLVQLLNSVLVSPDQPLATINLVTPYDHSMLASWNCTTVEFQRDLSIHELIEAQTDRAPSRIALRSDGSVLDYAALDARANRLARLLRSRGVGSGSMVGLCVPRDFDMVVCVLAVLKAGGTYLPLDPAFPRDRLAFMVEDSGLSLLVTHSELAARVDWPRDSSIWLDADAAQVEAQSAARIEPDAKASPESVAYVLYTSGSTGKPKGVQVPHRAVVNFLTSMAREPGLAADDRLVAVTTLSFDIAALELFLPLTVGAEVVLASREQASDGHALKVLIDNTNVTVMQATPTTWRILIEAGWQGGPAFRVLVGGEALPLDLAQRLIAMGCETWNMYGPTETTIWSTCWRVQAPEQNISIGRPIANTSVYILDQNRQICPINVPGEICIGGEGVTLGYLGRPELTAERFVADPFSDAPAARLYRTGDRGRWRADGTLEHLGRLDFQVKVRGYRIELGEVESALLAYPDIVNAVAMVREDRPGDIQIVGYVVTKRRAVAAKELREHLRAQLPDFMVPQHYVIVESIPLLPNGKVDRKSLPPPSRMLSSAAEHIDRNFDKRVQDPRVSLLQKIWIDTLGVMAGPDDNFFELGGDSMQALRMIMKVENAVGFRFNLIKIATGTMYSLAEELPEQSTRNKTERGFRALVNRMFGRKA